MVAWLAFRRSVQLLILQRRLIVTMAMRYGNAAVSLPEDKSSHLIYMKIKYSSAAAAFAAASG